MSTPYRLYNVEKKDMYAYKPKEEKIKIRKEMALMALEKGVKPTARYYKTYPKTVRKWLRVYEEENKEKTGS